MATNAMKGFYWMSKAAEQGHVQAMHDAAVAHLHGFGTEQNSTRALQIYKKAADMGHARSQTAIGIALQEGRFGLKVDHKQANTYLKFCSPAGLYPFFSESGQSPLLWMGNGAEPFAGLQVDAGVCEKRERIQ